MANHDSAAPGRVHVSRTTDAVPVRIGMGFRALGFSHTQFGGLMDPLVLVDHFTMTAPTFGPHAHAGMSAVSILFEDSVGRFHNRDSLGNDLDLLPGDLYWLSAGAGAVHDESPRPGARVHALQVFVNLPAARKHGAPEALHVPAAQMPVVDIDGARVRVMLGESNGVVGATSPARPLTVLDIQLDPASGYTHALPPDQGVWLHAVRGEVQVRTQDADHRLPQGKAVALRTAAGSTPIQVHSDAGAHVVLLHGTPVDEAFVQRGPFVMSTLEELNAVATAYAAGRLGSLDDPSPAGSPAPHPTPTTKRTQP